MLTCAVEIQHLFSTEKVIKRGLSQSIFNTIVAKILLKQIFQSADVCNQVEVGKAVGARNVNYVFVQLWNYRELFSLSKIGIITTTTIASEGS